MIQIKRYAITVQHEVVVYGYSEEAAKSVALRAYSAKTRCISIRELPPVEVEAKGITVIPK